MNHQQAKALVDALPIVQSYKDPEKLSLLTRVVSYFESNYGRGWSGAGVGSHNWGAITGKYKGQAFQHKDSRPELQPDGTTKQVEYTTDFRKYPSDEEGAADVARLLSTKYKSAVEAVPAWDDVARELYGYYLGFGTREDAIRLWASKGREAATVIQAATLETSPGVSLPAPTPGGGSLHVVIPLAIIAVSIAMFAASIQGKP